MDQLGHIWISTNKRVVEYDPKNGGIMDYSTMGDVTVNSFMPNSYFKSSSGKILYGGNRGISVFTPYEHLSDEPRRIKTMVANDIFYMVIGLRDNTLDGIFQHFFGIVGHRDNRELGSRMDTMHISLLFCYKRPCTSWL